MKLSIYSEYALLTLIHLARQTETSPARDIARSQHIPAEILVEIIFALSQSHYVQEVEGRFSLIKSADAVSVAEIIRLFDGALAPLEPVSSKGYVSAPIDQEEKLSGLFEQIQAGIVERLENTTIAELA
jgi:Rrf2 family transcriptional regulator, cysteine metabolism repressor